MSETSHAEPSFSSSGTTKIPISCGVPQGDPIGPLLFALSLVGAIAASDGSLLIHALIAQPASLSNHDTSGAPIAFNFDPLQTLAEYEDRMRVFHDTDRLSRD